MDQDELELVQAGVDGELGDAEKARLDALLAESAEARELHEKLRGLSAILDRTGPLEPPADLHARITDNIQLPRPSRTRSLFRFSALPGVFRYGVAAALAVVLTLAVYRGVDDVDPVADYADMVGTIARGEPVAGGVVIDSFHFRGASALGEVKLLERAGVFALEFQLDADEPVQFDVDFSGNGLAFDAFARQDLDLEAVSWNGETLSARARGEQRFVILMRRSGEPVAQGAKIGLSISQQGETIDSGWLEPGW